MLVDTIDSYRSPIGTPSIAESSIDKPEFTDSGQAIDGIDGKRKAEIYHYWNRDLVPIQLAGYVLMLQPVADRASVRACSRVAAG